MSIAAPAPSSGAQTRTAPPCTLVIFGGGGDLTKRLLMPSLYNLHEAGLLDPGFSIVGVDHLDLADEGWRTALSDAIDAFAGDPNAEFHAHVDPAAWRFIRDRLHYMKGDFAQPQTFRELGERLAGNVIFYLAVPARFFGEIVEGIGAAGLFRETDAAFRRVIIEKPFGSDLASARELNARILKVADERQVYRIDHFLGKETVQGLMALRFANRLYEPIWHRGDIDHVEITVTETIGVEGRGAFYEPTGAMRDMVPNHLFQLLSMVAMEPPKSLDAEDVRNEKAKLVAAVSPVDPKDAGRAQYGAGTLAGVTVKGYCEEQNVAPHSATETYVAVKLMIDNARWDGVPFYLRTGKRLAARRTEVVVAMKPVASGPFGGSATGTVAPNVLRLEIDPVHGARIRLNVKAPGPVLRLGTADAAFEYENFFKERPNVGYETLLYDCMMGDATLFQRADAIEAAWAAIDRVLVAWGRDRDGLETYASGTHGPQGADDLLTRDGRAWTSLDLE